MCSNNTTPTQGALARFFNKETFLRSNNLSGPTNYKKFVGCCWGSLSPPSPVGRAFPAGFPAPKTAAMAPAERPEIPGFLEDPSQPLPMHYLVYYYTRYHTPDPLKPPSSLSFSFFQGGASVGVARGGGGRRDPSEGKDDETEGRWSLISIRLSRDKD